MVITGTHIDLGAQNMHWEKNGAFTGEVSPGMLRDLFCHYVILGHSERRQYFGETDEIVNKKTKAALASNLKPIVCVGETLAGARGIGRCRASSPRRCKGSLAGLSPRELVETIHRL
jgi:triosephosphate isomerase